MSGTSESELLRHIYRRSEGLAAAFGQVVVGPGDDCAVVRVGGTGGGELLVTVDQLIEGRHFTTETPVDLIARKAVARSVSDVAAMGGIPVWGLATGMLPPGYKDGDALFDAMAKWAGHWGCPLVGGDIATGPAGAPLTLTVTVAGVPHATRGPVLRSGAHVGDGVWVTGRLGGSFASGRHLTFEPRLREAREACDALGSRLHAMIDLSDGLGRDGARVAEVSGVGMLIQAESLPRHEGVDWRGAVGDGEDYELLMVVENGFAPTEATWVGIVTRERGCHARMGGAQIDISRVGWEHGSGGGGRT